MRFLVVGAGSIGQRHGRNLAALGHAVLAWDADPERLRAAAVAGMRPAASLEAALATRPDGALICTPPASHVDLGRRALAAGAHLFVEKPIADASAAVPALLDLAASHGRVLAVGFNLRFLPSLRLVRRTPAWPADEAALRHLVRDEPARLQR